MAIRHHYGTGRRKTAIARTFLKPGSGQIIVNGRELADYFPNAVLRMMVQQPFVLTENVDKWDMMITVKGDRKSTRLNSSHVSESRMPSSA